MAKILVYSPSVIGKSMSGPSIRAWEISKALSKDHEIVLVAPNDCEIQSDDFKIISKSNPALKIEENNAFAMIVQVVTLPQVFKAKRRGIRIIADAYCPFPLELLELFKQNPKKEKEKMASNNTT